MLEEWHAGVKSGNPDAVVIAGATAPRGRGDAESTPPQAFARYLADHGVLDLMDAYSHHPYTPGGSTQIAPGEPPNNPDRAVTLGNLDQITQLFPSGTPFYLTEFGYNTEFSVWFGVTVSKADQARFLREGYAFTAEKYPQVKALLWFLVDDWNPSGEPGDDKGVYMGVRTFDGKRKPSWYAFAGGNTVTLAGPEAADADAEFTVTGALTVRRDPSVAGGQALTIQRRKPSGGPWVKVATVTTQADGTYSRTLKQRATRVYRVVWGGVCESSEVTVGVGRNDTTGSGRCGAGQGARRPMQRRLRMGRTSVLRVVVVTVLVTVALAAMAAVSPFRAAAAERGIVDNRLETLWPVDLEEVPALAFEIGSERLGARWTRVLVYWKRLQPSAPGGVGPGDADGDGYADAYVDELRTIVAALTANGVKVILTPMCTPEWASDRSVWRGGYMDNYPPAMTNATVKREFARMAAFLATGFGPRARYLEVWNEPNMGGALYPQTLPGDPWFAARVYLRMLKTFSAAAGKANPRAVVIAGATAPRGGNDAREHVAAALRAVPAPAASAALLRRLFTPRLPLAATGREGAGHAPDRRPR